MTEHPSVCPLDCPDRCSLNIQAENNRVIRIKGTHANPLTAGFVCKKVADFGDRIHGDKRILQPHIRSGPKGSGQYRPATWDEALDTITRRFQDLLSRHGGTSILPCWYGGSNGYLTGGGLDARFWHRLGAARLQRTLCAVNAGAGTRAVYGALPSTDLLDIPEASLIVLWGVNPAASGIHLLPLLKKVRDQGGQIVVVDPRHTPVARDAALHIAPLPGTDVVLALSLIHIAFRDNLADHAFLARHSEPAEIAALQAAALEWSPEKASAICGVSADEIEALARIYAASPKALLRAGWGMERNRNGSDGVRAVLCLPAVFGKFQGRGTGYAMSASSGYKANLAPVQVSKNGILPKRVVNQSQLAHAMATLNDPPIGAVYVYDCNPVATLPDQKQVLEQFLREDVFVVVHEQVWNDSALVADVVLPATTFAEHEELCRSYGGYLLQWAEPAIAPVGESRSNHAVFQELAVRLGIADADLMVSPRELAREFVDAIPFTQGKAEQLFTEKTILLPHPVQFEDAFPGRPLWFTRNEAGEVVGPPRYRGVPQDEECPFILISPAEARAVTSTGFDDLPAGAARVLVNPSDAANLGIGEGDPVRLFNSVGEVLVKAELTSGVRPGVLSLPKGLWRSGTLNGWTSNAVVPARVDEHGGGACYNDARVWMERA